jgi:hypothetical protein
MKNNITDSKLREFKSLKLFLGITLMFAASAYSQRNSPSIDNFRIDQTKNIMHPENFGIANGNITTGIQYKDLISIQGIWAPPFVSSDFSFQATLNDSTLACSEYIWKPFFIERKAVAQKGMIIETNTVLIPEKRAFLITLTFTNKGSQQISARASFAAQGTLDRLMSDENWGFAAPKSSTPTVVRFVDNNTIKLEQGDYAVVLVASKEVTWDTHQKSFKSNISVPASGKAKLYFSFAIGTTEDATRQCREIAVKPETTIKNAMVFYDQKVSELFQRVPFFESDNAMLVQFYNRSLMPFLINRWDVPEFKLKPFYSSGSVKGGCVGEYLWDFGEACEIISLCDPQATKAHIIQFLETGVKRGFGFCPIYGGMLSPKYFYPTNQDKIIGLTYNYIKNTGDIAFLKERLGNGTVLDSIISEALFMDDLSKPIALINYDTCDPQHKGGQSHLEIRHPLGKLGYTHVIPDLNGRRYINYTRAAELSGLVGKPRPDLITRAESLRQLLKRELWDTQKKWFAYEIPTFNPPIREFRYTNILYFLLGTGVLDEEQESGLLSHLKEGEFLSKYGLYSIAKHDPSFNPADVDHGGPGAYNSFPPSIAKTLYKIGKNQQADDLLKRILWWGERMPYWGDSFYADTIRYREETPLQCDIGSLAGAQCVIFGMFGISSEFDGSVRIKPSQPSFANQLSLKGVRLCNQVFDVDMNKGIFKVSCQGKTLESKTGQTIIIKDGKLSIR